MSSELQDFSIELVKIAAQDSERKPQSYASAVLTAIPFGAAKSAVDIPKGMVDKAVDLTIRTGKAPKPKAFKAIVGRGLGRSLGSFLPGIATTPVFLGGMKQLATAKTDKDKKEGVAKILGSGFTYAALKGATEIATEKGLSGIKPKDFLRVARNVGGVRGILGVGGAASVAGGILSSRVGKKKKKDPTKRDFALGLVLGAGKGGLDELAEKGMKAFKTPKGLRGIAARAGGRSAAGAIGAVALGKVFDAYMKKTSSVATPLGNAAAYAHLTREETKPATTPSAVYDQMVASSKGMPTAQVYSAYAAHVARGEPEKNPTRRAVYYALTDTLRSRGERVPEPKSRSEVTAKVTSKGVPLLAIAGTVAAPGAILSALQSIPPDEKSKLLQESIDAQVLSANIEHYKGAPDELWEKTLAESGGGISGRTGDGSRFIMTSKRAGPEITAHELGHATAGALRTELLQSSLSQKGYRLGRLLSLAVPVTALILSTDPSFATAEELESKRKLVRLSGAVGAAMMAPNILEEAIASAKAVSYLRKAELDVGTPQSEAFSKALGRSLKKLGPAFLSYAAPLAAPILAARYLSKAKEGAGN